MHSANINIVYYVPSTVWEATLKHWAKPDTGRAPLQLAVGWGLPVTSRHGYSRDSGHNAYSEGSLRFSTYQSIMLTRGYHYPPASVHFALLNLVSPAQAQCRAWWGGMNPVTWAPPHPFCLAQEPVLSISLHTLRVEHVSDCVTIISYISVWFSRNSEITCPSSYAPETPGVLYCERFVVAKLNWVEFFNRSMSFKNWKNHRFLWMCVYYAYTYIYKIPVCMLFPSHESICEHLSATPACSLIHQQTLWLRRSSSLPALTPLSHQVSQGCGRNPPRTVHVQAHWLSSQQASNASFSISPAVL